MRRATASATLRTACVGAGGGTAEALPLPGQMKPVDEARRTPEPADLAARVNQATQPRAQPVRDGLSTRWRSILSHGERLSGSYRCCVRSPTSPCSWREQLARRFPVLSPPATPCAGSSAMRRAGSGATKQIHISGADTRDLTTNSSSPTGAPNICGTEASSSGPTWFRLRQYPQDQFIKFAGRMPRPGHPARRDQVDLANITFRYAVEGDRAPWRPLRAYDDGRWPSSSSRAGSARARCRRCSSSGRGQQLGIGELPRGNYMIVDRAACRRRTALRRR